MARAERSGRVVQGHDNVGVFPSVRRQDGAMPVHPVCQFHDAAQFGAAVAFALGRFDDEEPIGVNEERVLAE